MSDDGTLDDKQKDAALDALAMLSTFLHLDHDDTEALLSMSDDVEHWRLVAASLTGMLAVLLLQFGVDVDHYVASQRRRALGLDEPESPTA